MIIPIRCFSCGKVDIFTIPPLLLALFVLTEALIGDGRSLERYLKLIDEGVPDGLVISYYLSTIQTDHSPKRRYGPAGSEALLLPPHDHDSRRPH